MKYLILEDEINAYEYLRGLMEKLRPDAQCLDHIDSVEDGINWLHNATMQPDLILMDIQLSDGISFEIFKHVEVKSPVIFTTAYEMLRSLVGSEMCIRDRVLEYICRFPSWVKRKVILSSECTKAISSDRINSK